MKGLPKKLLISVTIVLCLVIIAGCTGNDSNGSQEDPADTEDELQEGPETDSMIISSSAFENGSQIPEKYTCDGEGINPPLDFENMPEGTKSLVLLINDPDAPSGSFTHWLVWDISPVSQISENSVPGTVGMNSFGQAAYGGPCPSSGMHLYQFKVFALDTEIGLAEGSDLVQVERSMQGHILAQGELTGTYRKA